MGAQLGKDIMPEEKNITSVAHRVQQSSRQAHNGHRGGVLWLTGLSGSGKSTLAFMMEERLFAKGWQAYVLDGDNMRHGLNQDLGFDQASRTENIRRVGEVAALFADAGLIAISAFISPYREDRRTARQATQAPFHELYVKADLAVCEARDPKGLYKKARQGAISDFTGVSAPYELPEKPELTVDTANQDVPTCVAQIERYVEQHFGDSS